MRDLYGIYDLFTELASFWQVTGFNSSAGRASVCSVYWYYLGGPGVAISSGYMRRTFKNLVPHDILYISFEFVLSGDWQPYDSFSVDVDGVSSVSWSLGPQIKSMATTQCQGMISKSLDSYVIGKVFHTVGRVTVTIHFSISKTANAIMPSIAIRDLTVVARYRQAGDMEGFYVTIEDSTLQNSTKCSRNHYLPDGTFPLVCTGCTTTYCDICNGIGDVNCARPGWATFYSGSGYSKCTTNCDFCIDPTANGCVQCSQGYVLDYNNTCQTSCTSPYQPWGNNAKKCLMPCNTTQYLYWNNTCRNSCNFPLQIDITTQQCTYPCNKAYAEFLYWNGSCLTTCPFHMRNESGYAFCDACAEDYFIFLDDAGICKLGCDYPYEVKDTIYCSLDLSQSDLEQARTISKIISITSQSLSIGCFLLNLFNPSDSSAFTLVAIAKMLLYTRYMDLKYPPKLQSVLDQQTPNLPSIKFLRDAQDLLKKHLTSAPLPEKFDHYKLCSSFLVNLLQPLLILLAMLVVTLILCLTKYLYKKENKFRALVCKTVDSLKWNLLITLSISNYDGIILYSSLEIRSTINTEGSFLYILSYMTAMIMLLVISVISAKTISIVVRFREAIGQQPDGALRIQRLAKFKIDNKGYQVLYKACKDSNLSQQSFLLIFTGRLILFHITIASLIYYPLAQAIIILIMNLVMILYLFIQSPIKEKLPLVQQILQEMILLVVNVCILVIASLDLSEKLDISTRIVVGAIILNCNLILSILGPVFTVLLIIVRLLAFRRGAQAPTELRVALPNRAMISGETRSKKNRPRLSHINEESRIGLFHSRLDQSQTRDLSSILPNPKHKSNNDERAVKASGQSRLKRGIDRNHLSKNLVQNHKDSSLLGIDTVSKAQMKRKLDGRSIDIAEEEKYQEAHMSTANVNKQNQVKDRTTRTGKSTKAAEGKQKIIARSDLILEDYSLGQLQAQKMSSVVNPQRELEQKKSKKMKRPEICDNDISKDEIPRRNEERRPVKEITVKNHSGPVDPIST